MDECLQLKSMINKYDNIVFFGGAGVSTEGGNAGTGCNPK